MLSSNSLRNSKRIRRTALEPLGKPPPDVGGQQRPGLFSMLDRELDTLDGTIGRNL
jgi:hypothetical protein